jgi:putative ATP-dependent endonuclease of the OLD family
MRLSKVHVKNFRSVWSAELLVDPMTALVGANGTGKSTFLRAIEIFYSPTPKLDADDFYNGDTSIELTVAVTFADLTETAADLFERYTQGGELVVERVFTMNDGRVTSKYHGSTLQCPQFDDIRRGLEVKDRGMTARAAYDAICADEDFAELPVWTSLNAAPEAMSAWEEVNPTKCIRARDDGQFFGFANVASGYLGRFTRFLFIPAVRDAAADAAEGRGSVFTALMDLVVRSVLASKEEVAALKVETQRRYEEILNPENINELTSLSTSLTSTLQTYVPDAEVQLIWMDLDMIEIPMPKANVRLVEDGYSSSVEKSGHGLQRAFIITMLQHLSAAQLAVQDARSEANAAGEQPNPDRFRPNLVLALEEPELYQHPSRQRHFAKVLMQLAGNTVPGVSGHTQVLYCTHSPLFVGLDRVNELRLLRKVAEHEAKPKVTKVVSTSLDAIAEVVWRADGAPGTKYTGATLRPRMHTLMTPWMSEGFFASVAVLVEGEDDRSALLGTASRRGIDFDSAGIAVIPCGGKTSLDRPAAIFRELGIPVYLLWDSDRGATGAKPEDNHRLLRLVAAEIEDWPAGVKATHACFEVDLESTFDQELGQEDYSRWLQECQTEFGIPKKKHARKNPYVVTALLERAAAAGKTCNSLDLVVDRIWELR